MGLFRHPHLVRGVVHTSKGSFAINRGLVSVPDEVGESHGWLRLEPEDQRDRPPPSHCQARSRGSMPLEF